MRSTLHMENQKAKQNQPTTHPKPPSPPTQLGKDRKILQSLAVPKTLTHCYDINRCSNINRVMKSLPCDEHCVFRTFLPSYLHSYQKGVIWFYRCQNWGILSQFAQGHLAGQWQSPDYHREVCHETTLFPYSAAHSASVGMCSSWRSYFLIC